MRKMLIWILCFVMPAYCMAAFPTTGILDNFNRGDEQPATGWTDMVNGVEVISNQLSATTNAAYNWVSWDATTYGPDCEAYITFSTLTSGGVGLILRGTTENDNTCDGYAVWGVVNGDESRVYEIKNGSFTQVGSGDAFTWANGDKLGGEIIGSTIKVYIDDGGAGWAVNTTETDATYGSAGYLQFRIYDDDPKSDDFGGGTIVSATDEGQVIFVNIN